MTNDILSAIVDTKKKEIAAAKKLRSENELRRFLPLPKAPLFLKALESPGPQKINIIAEIKRASPSKGDIKADLDASFLARAYERGGAACLSVLTDKTFFQSRPEDLPDVMKATRLPVLRKDFLISSYQLYESALLGVDAVLLIVRILSKTQLGDYLALARELGMDALVEVNSLKELEVATTAGAKLIGINNRNLKSFATNINTALNLVRSILPHQVAVAASGIKSREDIERNLAAGLYNFLIGESLVRSPAPESHLKRLMAV